MNNNLFSKFVKVTLAANLVALLVLIIVLILGIVFVWRHYTSQEQRNGSVTVNIELPEDAPVLGNSNAPVTIVEFGDFQCPYCREFHSKILPFLKSQYIDTGKAQFVFQNFVFLGPESQSAAEAVKCAQVQGKFWEYHDILYNEQKPENSGALTDNVLQDYAKRLNLNQDSFNSCLSSHSTAASIGEETRAGSQYGISGTPAVFINGVSYEGVLPIKTYEQAINSILESK